MPSVNDDIVWGSAVEAANLLACDAKQVPKLAAKGFITVRRLPGCDPRYLMSDVDRLAKRATVPAVMMTRCADETENSAGMWSRPTETGTKMSKKGGDL